MYPIYHVDKGLSVALLKIVNNICYLLVREDCVNEGGEFILGNGVADQSLPGLLVGVIVMTFWYVCWNGLNFFELFKLYFHLGLITTPHVFYDHMTYVYSFSFVSFFTRSYGQEKSLSYYDLLLTLGVLLYGRIPTLIFFYFLHNPTTPILPVYVDQQRSHLEKDTTRP